MMSSVSLNALSDISLAAMTARRYEVASRYSSLYAMLASGIAPESEPSFRGMGWMEAHSGSVVYLPPISSFSVKLAMSCEDEERRTWKSVDDFGEVEVGKHA